MWSVSYIKLVPTHEKKIAVGKSGPNGHFLTYFCLGFGLGWSWVGEFVGFRNFFFMFSNPTEVCKSHRPYYGSPVQCLGTYGDVHYLGKQDDRGTRTVQYRLVYISGRPVNTPGISGLLRCSSTGLCGRVTQLILSLRACFPVGIGRASD